MTSGNGNFYNNYDINKEIVVTFDETFLNLEDEEFYKYLEIAKKTLSGTLGNNLLELEFPIAEESAPLSISSGWESLALRV